MPNRDSIPSERAPFFRTVWELFGAKFWITTILVLVGLTIALAEFFILNDAFEAFHVYTRDHEDWDLDDIAMAMLAGLIALVFVGLFVIVAVSRKLIRKEIERQEANLRIEQTQRLVSLGTLLGGTAHALNNHLLPVITLSDLVRRECAPDSPHAKDLEMISVAAKRAVEMNQKLKTFARSNSDIEGTCLIEPATKAAIELARKVSPSSVKLLLSFDQTPGRVGLSETALEIVVLNIVNNAIDAMEGKPGTIAIQLSTFNTAPVNNRSARFPAKAWARIQINDTGKGMDPDECKRIFDPFFTTKPVGKGTGLGLSETYGIVDKAGGRFDVKSEVGVGSQIGILLPLIDEAKAAQTANLEETIYGQDTFGR